MKKLITILFLIFLFNAFSQSPESFNYQAVIRNSSGDIISNQTIGIQFRILSGSASGNSTYQETFTTETSSNGLVALQIGSGNAVSGDFATIDWGNGPFFLETSIDLNGGSSFDVIGTSQLVSVPYALYAKTSGSSTPGPQGESGIDGKTILNGTIAPTTEGVDGDFYINTATNEIFGPKTNDIWGTPTALTGPAGSDGEDGSNGVDGNDGTDGQDGADGSDGNTVLNGTVAPTSEGVNGDFYINTATSEIYGPKTAEAWGSPTSLIGAQGPAGIGGGSAATYRWATFHSYSNNLNQWAFNNDPNMFGGVAPSQWTDASAIASQMSSDKEVLRTLFQHKGYATRNAMIINDEHASFSSTNGKVAMVLMRIRNNTSSPILWSPHIVYSAYGAWGEKASAALNGVTVMNETTTGIRVLSDLAIPPNRTSTFIVVSTSSAPSVTQNMRLCRLGFISNTLDLPAGLEFVDDLDTATGGWEQ